MGDSRNVGKRGGYVGSFRISNNGRRNIGIVYNLFLIYRHYSSLEIASS